ncbi:MAG: hypothetical protein WC750_05190 [Patescibacteria group bacterium]|jgi:hypothetical protein
MASRKKALSQAQQREIYTREGWVNGYNLGKLTAWAGGQELALTPDELMWRKLFNSSTFALRVAIKEALQIHAPGKIITSLTSPSNLLTKWVTDTLDSLSEPQRWLASHLDWSRVRAIPIGSTRLALVDTMSPHGARVIHLEEDDDEAHVQEFSESDMLDVVLEAWEGNKSTAASRWLFNRLQSAITFLRSLAGEYFDTAVAVSPDGKRVLDADYVIVYSRNAKKRLTFRSYQSVAFLLHKIRLGTPHVIRLDLPARKKTEEGILKGLLMPCVIKKHLDAAAAMKRSQTLVKLGELKILFIPASDVPDELKAPLASTAPPPAASSDAPATSPTQPSPGSEAVPVVSIPPPSRVEVVKPIASSTMPAVLDPNNAQGTPSSTPTE